MRSCAGDTRVLSGHDCGERAAAGGTRLEVAELAFQVSRKPAAALALEGPQVIHSPLEFLTLLGQ
jgi:hypothetical protein